MKKTGKSLLILAVAFGAAAFTNTMKKTVKSANIEWTGKKVTGQHNGTIDLKEGYFEMDGEEITGGQFIIDMSSIVCSDLEGDSKGKLEGHLKSDDFFGVEKYPTATLEVKDATKTAAGYKINGLLTIKENTEPISFDLNWSDDKATTSLTIDRSKYNVRYGSGSFFDNLGDKTIYDDFTLDITLNF